MSGSGQKVCCVGGDGLWWLRPIIVLSFAKAEQLFYSYHTEQAINTLGW